jgi:hypothetical protein
MTGNFESKSKKYDEWRVNTAGCTDEMAGTRPGHHDQAGSAFPEQDEFSRRRETGVRML